MFGMRARTLTLAAGAAALLAAAPTAFGATRYAAPASDDAVGSCSALAPCRLDHAVGGASAGDEVVVRPGTYQLHVGAVASSAIFVHGVPGQARPRIVGAAGLATSVLALDGGGVARHLRIEGNAALFPTLSVEHGLVEGVEVIATDGDGIEARGASLIRDSVSRASGEGTPLQAKDGLGGSPTILGVSAVAASGDAMKVKSGTATTIRNSVLRGGANDIRVYPRGQAIADHSNFTTTFSSGLADGGGNQTGDPGFSDAAAGDLRPIASSPLVDAGASDPRSGVGDAARNSRVAGSAPDIGAYELGAGPLDPAADLTPPAEWITLTGDKPEDDGITLAPPAAPIAGSRVNVAPVSGTVAVRPRGEDSFVALEQGASVPVGSTLDTRRGVVALTSARDQDGATQTGRFWGGRFRVSQARSGDPYTYLTLAGRLRGCRTAAARGGVTAAGKRRVRRLWGRDRGGRFRTRGRRGQATVRGTKWLTEDRCGGTLYRVKHGKIVVRAGKRKHVLRAGQRVFLRRR